jgi:hypothetical protein
MVPKSINVELYESVTIVSDEKADICAVNCFSCAKENACVKKLRISNSEI